MQKDVPIAPTGRHGSGTSGKGGAHEKKDRSVLVFGAAAGFAIGVLDLFAIAHEWKLRELFDYPFVWLAGAEVEWDAYAPVWLCGILLYWTFIGGVMASVFRLIRAGVIDGIIISVVRRKTCMYTLLSGVTLGMLFGILDIVSIFNHWKLQYDFFDIVDIPFRSFDSEIFYTSTPISWTDADALQVALLMVCYWMAVGLFFAALVCLVWTGVARDVARDRICRYALFFGPSGGMFIGSLRFLPISRGWWGLTDYIVRFEQPVTPTLYYALGERSTIAKFVPGDSYTKAHNLHYLVVLFYWAIVGLFVASFYCVIRIGKKRKAAAENRVSEEKLSRE